MNFLSVARDRFLREAEKFVRSGVFPGELKTAVTTAQTLPVSEAGKPIKKEWTAAEGITDGFKANHWVYACVNRLMKSGSSVPWRVRERSSGKLTTDHPLEALMAKPNPFMTGQDLVERGIAHLYLAGNALWSKSRVGAVGPKVVAELWPISPDIVKPIPDQARFIREYEVKVGSETKPPLKPEDVIHLMFTDPATPYWGMSPMQAAAEVIATEVDAVTWWRKSIQNRTVPDGAIKFKERITRKQWEAARDSIKEHRAGPDHAREMLVLGADADFVRFSLSPAEMDFIGTRKITRIDICSIFGVPPPLVGIYDDATLANIETARLIFWLDTVIPVLDDVGAGLNLALGPEFGTDTTGNPLFELVYDLSKVQALQALLAKKAEIAGKLWAIGYTRNQINRRIDLGFEEDPEGDVSYLPSSFLPASDAGDGNQAGADAGKGEDLGDRFSAREFEEWKALGIDTAERRTFYWKAIDRRRQAQERVVDGRAKSILREEGEAVVAAFLKGGTEGAAIAAVKSQEAAWDRMLTSSWKEAIALFGGVTASTLGGTTAAGAGPDEEKSWRWDPWPQHVQNAVRRWVGQKIVRISSTTVQRVARTISDAFADGLSIPQTAALLQDLYSGFSRYRSHVIARTEILGASNYGSQEAVRQSGLRLKKRWLDSQDDRVRELHEGRGTSPEWLVELAADYPNGMKFPGDPDGPAEEVIQCRCVETYEKV